MKINTESKLEKYEKLINGIYVLNKLKPLGSSEKTFKGRVLPSNQPIVIKYEKYYKNNLYKERKYYNCLKGIKSIPKIYWFGREGQYNYLILEYLGPSLEILFRKYNKKFSLGTILKLSIKMLSILKKIHEQGIILRYIKLENIVIGKNGEEDRIYFIDFEYAKKYIKKGRHILFKEYVKRIIGRRKFISLNAENGFTISRRDDIESLIYNIIYLMKGELPWSSSNKNESKYLKENIESNEFFSELPEEIKLFVKYVKNMEFSQNPDYEYLNELLLKLASKNNINIYKTEFDWENNYNFNYKSNIYFKRLIESERNTEIIQKGNSNFYSNYKNNKKNNNNENEIETNDDKKEKEFLSFLIKIYFFINCYCIYDFLYEKYLRYI